jgi:hypothetical protein
MFAGAAILILAVGIGASTAMFSVIHGVLLRPLPYLSADRIVMLWGKSKQMSRTSVSLPDYRDWVQSSRSFEHLALVRSDDVLLTIRNDPQMVSGALVTADFFRVFDLPPQIGRTFAASDDVPGAAAAMILSHAFWQSRFAGDPHVVGRAVRVGDDPVTVVGVMPPTFNMPMGTDVWLAFGPHADTAAWRSRANRPGFVAVATLRPGLALTSAQRDISAIAARLALDHPESNAGFDVIVTPIMEHIVGDYRRTLWILLGSVIEPARCRWSGGRGPIGMGGSRRTLRAEPRGPASVPRDHDQRAGAAFRDDSRHLDDRGGRPVAGVAAVDDGSQGRHGSRWADGDRSINATCAGSLCDRAGCADAHTAGRWYSTPEKLAACSCHESWIRRR